MPKMLRHKVTGEVWPMNPDMARSDTMEVFEEPDPQFAEAKEEAPKPAPKRKAAPKKKEPATDDVDLSGIDLGE